MASRAAFAAHARRHGRRCSSLVGSADEVLDLWRMLAPVWGPARDVRDTQPLMSTAEPPIARPTRACARCGARRSSC